MIIVIKAKIVPPRLSGTLVQRALVGALVDRARDVPLMLVCAPAGYGKTTLANQYARATGSEVCWYGLDPLDNDTVVFGRYLVESLAQHVQLSVELRNRARHGQFPNLDRLMRCLLQELEGLKRRVVLVLDDFHVLRDLAILAAVDRLVQYLPCNVQLLIVTRTRPTHLSRSALCADDWLSVEAADLSFSVEEMRKLFHAHGRELSASAAQRLNLQAQGWVAGLKLIALSFRGAAPPEMEPPLESAGIHHYLFHEVYLQQPEPLRRFLMETSVSERFNRSLARALTGRDDIDALLDTLNRQQFFITQLGGDDEWFRYHPLLADFLRQRLADEGRAGAVHLRAAGWWLGAGHLNIAADHFAASRDVTEICNFFHVYGPALFNDGHTHAMSECLAVLPADVIAEHLDLTLMAAWHENVVERRCDRVEKLIRAAEAKRMERMPEAEARRGVLAILGGLCTGLALTEQGPEAALALAEEAMALWRDEPTSDKLAAVYSELSNIHLESGCLDEAMRWSLKAADVDRLHSMHLGVFWHLYQQATLLAAMGDILGAERRLEDAMTLARELNLGYLPLYDAWLRQHGRLLWLRMQFQEADKAIAAAIEHCRRWPHAQLANLVWHCRIALGRLDLAAADALALRIESGLFAAHTRPETAAEAWDVLMQAWMVQGDRMAMSRFLLQPLPPPEARSPAALSRRRIRALALLMLERGEEALALIEPHQAQSEAAGMLLEHHHGRIIHVMTLWSLGRRDEALQRLPALLRWVSQQRVPMLPLDYAGWLEAPLAELLDELPPGDRLQGPAAALAQRIRQRIALMRKGQSLNQPDTLQVYGLTPQEWEVFRLIGLGYSNDAICDELNLTMNTVRCHIRRMNKKLGVHTRDEAIHLSLKLAHERPLLVS